MKNFYLSFCVLILSLLPWSITIKAQSYCECTSTSDYLGYFTNVTFGDISNDSGREKYGNFTTLSTTVSVGSQFAISANVDSYTTGDHVHVWVDWNQDYIFSDDEMVILNPATKGSVTSSGTVIVPPTALAGSTRLRIIYQLGAKEPEPCTNMMFGEVEDYTVTVQAYDISPDFNTDKTSAEVGEEIVFTDASAGSATGYVWNFGNGATPATANSAGPHTVTYSTSGTKTVLLEITNGTTTKSISKNIEIVKGSSSCPPPKYFGANGKNNIITMSWATATDVLNLNTPEGFESGIFPLFGWEIKVSEGLTSELKDLKEDQVTWELNSDDHYVHSGRFSAYISETCKQSNWLITPPVTVGNNKQLSFYPYFKNYNGFTSELNIMVKEGDNAWVSIKTFDKNSDVNLMQIAEKADLSAYAGKEIKLAFVQSYTNGYAMAIDDITIEDITTDKRTNNEMHRTLRSSSVIPQLPIIIKENNRSRSTYINRAVTNKVNSDKVPTGFKIYVDNTMIQEVAADARSYKAENITEGEHTCSVQAVYADGESFLVDPVTVTTTNPVVNFTVDKTIISRNESVQFTIDIKGSHNSIEWNFGEGATPQTSSEKNPVVSYSTLGKKSVSVIVNGIVTATGTDLITVRPGDPTVPVIENFGIATNYNRVKLSWLPLTSEEKFSEGFEGETFPPAGWSVKKTTVINQDHEEPEDDEEIWFQCNAESFDGSGADYVKNGDKSAAISLSAKRLTWLITPEIDIEDKDMLSFWMWYNNGYASDNIFYHTNFHIMVKTDEGWNDLMLFNKISPSNKYQKEVYADLSEYAGKSVQIAFIYNFSNGWQMAIDDVAVINTTAKRSIADNFTKLNIYRDDAVVHEVTDITQTEWIDENLETGGYKYYITVVDGDNKESYPSEEGIVKVYKTIDIPYNQDFESGNLSWMFNEGEHKFAIGENGDFAMENYDIPAHDGKFVAVNTSDIKNGYFVVPALDVMPLPTLNLEAYGRVYFELDYLSDMPMFGIVGRDRPGKDWELLHAFDKSENWTKAKVNLPDRVLKDGYQLGMYYSNHQEVSKGVAFDNIKITSCEGEHITIQYLNKEIENNADQYLGMIKPEITEDYTFTIKNIGTTAVDLSNIVISDGRFTIKNSPANTTLDPKSSSDIVVTYTPTGTTTTPDNATITINSNAEENPYIFNVSADCGIAKWTYMLYLYEDGTGLDGNRDLNEWEVLGSVDKDINYVVLYDANDDSKDGIYYIQKDPDGSNSTLISTRVSTHLNENINMNNYKTLQNFILWTKENYPAEHYGCNVWDHGSGIFDRAPQWKAACGQMKVWELASALKAFKDVDDKGFDIFGFDVCLLGQVETVYDIKDYTDIVIASEKTTPGNGWDYTTMFQSLNDNPDIDKYQLADNMVIAFDASYDGGSQGSDATTISATRTDKFNSEFIPALNAFVDQINPDVFEIKSDISAAVKSAWYSDGIDFVEHRDFGHFLTLLKSKESVSAEVKAKIDKLLTAYNNSIIKSLDNQRVDATGLKMWIPDDVTTNAKSHFYLNAEKYLKISETKWDEFLKMYEHPIEKGVPQPMIEVIGETSITANNIVQFADITECNPVSTGRTWSVTPDTYEFANGTDASSETVDIRFTATGSYTVTLAVTNSEGEGTVAKENVVTVREPVFIAPKNLISSQDNRDITLSWEEGDETFPGGVKFEEGFESTSFPPAGWSVKHSATLTGSQSAPTEGGAKTWFHCNEMSFADAAGNPNKDYIHSGDYSAAIGYSAPEFNWLIMPSVNVKNGDMLKFWAWYYNGEYQGTNYHTNFRVMILADNTWNEALYYTEGAEPNDYKSEITIDLSAYKNKPVKIAFVYEFTDGFQLAIDDVKIQSASSRSRIKDGTLEGYKVYRDKEVIATVNELTYSEQLVDETATYEYYVTAVYSNPEGESEASNKVTINTTKSTTNGINEYTNAVRVYPNPSGGQFIIETKELRGFYSIVNSVGTVIKSGSVNSDITNVSINKPGIYMIKIISDSMLITRKVVIK
jgi:PKD repeat protein